jgi:hypothetical protein
MRINNFYYPIFISALFVCSFQKGRYDGYGTLFGYRTERYYKIEENEKKYKESKKTKKQN